MHLRFIHGKQYVIDVTFLLHSQLM